jgi:hypothetical protein
MCAYYGAPGRDILNPALDKPVHVQCVCAQCVTIDENDRIPLEQHQIATTTHELVIVQFWIEDEPIEYGCDGRAQESAIRHVCIGVAKIGKSGTQCIKYLKVVVAAVSQV